VRMANGSCVDRLTNGGAGGAARTETATPDVTLLVVGGGGVHKTSRQTRLPPRAASILIYVYTVCCIAVYDISSLYNTQQ